MTSAPTPLVPAFSDPSELPSEPVWPAATAVLRHDSPIGRLHIHTRQDAITRLDIEPERDCPRPALDPAGRFSPVHDAVRRQLDEYFDGRRRRFDLPLEQAGTRFQHEVWSALGRVPWGDATSYGRLADDTGRPTGARAVGGAIRANRIALLVPCHRVLGTGRRLTGYSPGDGLATKRWLLDHEGVDYVE